MNILVEQNFNGVRSILDEAAGEKKLYIEGIFLQGVVKNRNGRIYPTTEIQRAVNKINEAAASNEHILGELDHPDSLTVKLQNASHKILTMEMVGDNAVGKALILDTPMGNIARGLAKDINLGVSSRGSGVVNESTGVVEDYDIVTVDIVATPSAQSAYTKSIQEHLEMYYNATRRDELYKLAEAINHDKAAQKYFQEEIVKFMKSLSEK